MSKEKVDELLKKTADLSTEELLRFVEGEFGDKIAFATSLGEEDQVILDMVTKHANSIRVFTLDTGRLFQETYDLINRNEFKYAKDIEVYFPDAEAVEKMVKDRGVNLFYESIENRKLCCQIRKIEPLKRALVGMGAWITGLRRSQSVTRDHADVFEWDESNGLIKINPLVHWTIEKVREYITTNEVDTNELHEKGYVSIGCAPCTRPINEGEDIRTGRWWWEDPDQKECGLHNNPKRPKTS